MHISDLKLAMSLSASKGRKTAIDKIYPRHFLATAKALKFPEQQMQEIMQMLAEHVPLALDTVISSLPNDFSTKVVTSIRSNVLRLHARLCK